MAPKYLNQIKQLAENAKEKLFSLRQKGTGVRVSYRLVEEEALKMFKCQVLRDFDTSRLEAEYDYDTDVE